MPPIQLLNPLDLPNWDSLVLAHPTATPFHSSGWARVLRDTYGFTPYYACVFKGATLSACLPLMEVNSFLTGKRGVSLPFTDFCEHLLNGTVSSRELTDFAVALGRDRCWKYLELRSSEFSAIPGEEGRGKREEGRNSKCSYPNALAPCDSRLTDKEGRGKREEGSNSLASPQGEGRGKMEDGSEGQDGRWKREEGSNGKNAPERDGRGKMEATAETGALRSALSAQSNYQEDRREKMEDGRKGTANPIIPSFQHSNTPQSGFSTIPSFQNSRNGDAAVQPQANPDSIITSCPPSPPFSLAMIDNNSTNSTTSPKFSPFPPFSRKMPFASFSHHILDLTTGPDRLFANLRESTRRNIRKAEKEGVTVRFATDLEAVKTYFRLHCQTRKRHGVPPQPWLFFENIHKNLISGDQGFVALAEYQGKEIAGAVYLTFGGSALYKFGASDLSYQHLRANNSAMWAAIRRLAESGFRTLSFGRTDPENQGLIRFKSGWGTVEERQDYFRYDFSKQDFISGYGKGPAGYEKVFQKLPEPALRLMGKVLYRHFGS